MNQIFNANWQFVVLVLALAFVPLFLYVLLRHFKEEIRPLFGRVSKIEINKVGSITFRDEVATAKESADAAKIEKEQQEKAAGIEMPECDPALERLQPLIDTDPRRALIGLRKAIEDKIRHYAATMGYDDIARLPISHAIAEMERRGLLSPLAKTSIDKFLIVSNRIELPGPLPPSDEDVQQAIDVAVTLLNAIPTVAAERHYVEESGIIVYSLPDCLPSQKWANIKAVKIRSLRPNGQERIRMFATKKQYQRGQEVTFELNDIENWGEAWYREVDGEIKVAWRDSPKFRGRAVEHPLTDAEVIEYGGTTFIAKDRETVHGRTVFQRWCRGNGSWRMQSANDCSFPNREQARAFLNLAKRLSTAVLDAVEAFAATDELEKSMSLESLKKTLREEFAKCGVTLDETPAQLQGWLEDRRTPYIADGIGNGPLEAAFIILDRVLKAEGEPPLSAT